MGNAGWIRFSDTRESGLLREGITLTEDVNVLCKESISEYDLVKEIHENVVPGKESDTQDDSESEQQEHSKSKIVIPSNKYLQWDYPFEDCDKKLKTIQENP